MLQNVIACVVGVGPGLSTENMLQSIAAALHNNTRPITGQNASKGLLQKNPAISINTEQPLIQVSVSLRAQWLRGTASDSRLREPGFKSCAAVLKPWASFLLYITSVHSAV